MFLHNIVEDAKQNTLFRREVVTGQYCQVVLMCVPPEKQIGNEISTVDQILIFVEGEGEAVVAGEHQKVRAGSIVFIRACAPHNIVNTLETPLKLYMICAPPEHPPGTVDTYADDKRIDHGHGTEETDQRFRP